MEERIKNFLAGNRFAVAGASRDRTKYGNKVLRAYQQAGKHVVPINPKVDEVEGLAAVAEVSELDGSIDGISIVTPPKITEQIVAAAIDKGIKNVWMQPGAESETAVEQALQAGLNVIHGGPCILVTLRYREEG